MTTHRLFSVAAWVWAFVAMASNWARQYERAQAEAMIAMFGMLAALYLQREAGRR